MGAKLALQNQRGRGRKRNDGMKRETVRHYERRSKIQGKTLQAVIETNDPRQPTRQLSTGNLIPWAFPAPIVHNLCP